MKNLLIWIAMPLLAVAGPPDEMQTESIPNTELSVTFPSDWNYIRPYRGQGRYSSLNIGIPTREDGGAPVYPQFLFEFIEAEEQSTQLERLLDLSQNVAEISGTTAHEFYEESTVRFLLGDMSHAYSKLEVGGYIVPVSKGHLICKLSATSRDELDKYMDTLRAFCSSAIDS